jgi:hypothetical protein
MIATKGIKLNDKKIRKLRKLTAEIMGFKIEAGSCGNLSRYEVKVKRLKELSNGEKE